MRRCKVNCFRAVVPIMTNFKILCFANSNSIAVNIVNMSLNIMQKATMNGMQQPQLVI